MTIERITTLGHFDTPSLRYGYSMTGGVSLPRMISIVSAMPLLLPGAVPSPPLDLKKKCCKKHKEGKRCKDCPKR